MEISAGVISMEKHCTACSRAMRMQQSTQERGPFAIALQAENTELKLLDLMTDCAAGHKCRHNASWSEAADTQTLQRPVVVPTAHKS